MRKGSQTIEYYIAKKNRAHEGDFYSAIGDSLAQSVSSQPFEIE
jgi:hypothetical protein